MLQVVEHELQTFHVLDVDVGGFNSRLTWYSV